MSAPVQPELFGPEEPEDPRPGVVRHRVRVVPAARGEGYVLVDAGGHRLFGGVRFQSPGAAEAHVARANRESRWVRWQVVRPRRRRRRRAVGPRRQLDLFPSGEG